jgi:hypothetical protein
MSRSERTAQTAGKKTGRRRSDASAARMLLAPFLFVHCDRTARHGSAQLDQGATKFFGRYSKGCGKNNFASHTVCARARRRASRPETDKYSVHGAFI